MSQDKLYELVLTQFEVKRLETFLDRYCALDCETDICNLCFKLDDMHIINE